MEAEITSSPTTTRPDTQGATPSLWGRTGLGPEGNSSRCHTVTPWLWARNGVHGAHIQEGASSQPPVQRKQQSGLDPDREPRGRRGHPVGEAEEPVLGERVLQEQPL